MSNMSNMSNKKQPPQVPQPTQDQSAQVYDRIQTSHGLVGTTRCGARIHAQTNVHPIKNYIQPEQVKKALMWEPVLGELQEHPLDVVKAARGRAASLSFGSPVTGNFRAEYEREEHRRKVEEHMHKLAHEHGHDHGHNHDHNQPVGISVDLDCNYWG